MRRGCVAACVMMAGLAAGCGSPRMVRYDQSGGIVALPSNTNTWPNYYRDQAEAMIRARCPNGYEIVSEHEEVTGQVAHTNTQTQEKKAPTVLIGGQNSADKKVTPNDGVAAAFAALAVPVGETEQTTQQTTTYSTVSEWRIEYRANPAPTGRAVTATPTAPSPAGSATVGP